MFNKILISLCLCLSPSLVMAQAQCTTQLENQLDQMPNWMLQPSQPVDGDVSVQCVAQSMAVFYEWTTSVRMEREAQGKREIGHYVYCDSKNRMIKKHEPPCPTPNYLNTIANTYNTVLRCLGYEPRELFALTAVESGFQVNTLSLPGVDIGIGQLTEIAVDDVNPHWQDYLNEILSSDSPECETIKPLVVDMKKVTDNLTCELTNLPENPIKNLIYITFLHKKNDDYMRRLFQLRGIRSKIESLIGRAATVEEISKIQQILITLSYNAGSPTAIAAIEDFMKIKSQPRSAISGQVESKTQEAALMYLTSQEARISGNLSEMETLLSGRQMILEEIQELREKKLNFRVSIQDFAINEDLGSFGKWLTTSETSVYLQVLKDRIEYVEEGLNSPGACGPVDYLESI